MTFFDPDYHPGDGYYPLPRHWSRDPRLRLTDKGLLAYWASHERGYRVTITQIIAESADGKDAIYASIERLIEHGYLVRERETNAKGRVERFSYRWGPAAISQQYERNWGTQETAGQSTSGKSGSGPDSDVSAGETTSGFSGSGKTGSGKPDAKKTNSKNTKKRTTPPPTPSADSSDAAPAEEEKKISKTETPAAAPSGGDDEKIEKAVHWLTAKDRTKWRPEAVRDAIVKAMAERNCTVEAVFYPLRALAEGKYGKTWSPNRVLEDGEWWTAKPPRPAQTAETDPHCQKKNHEVYRSSNCPLCRDEAQQPQTVAEKSDVDPRELARQAAGTARRRDLRVAA